VVAVMAPRRGTRQTDTELATVVAGVTDTIHLTYEAFASVSECAWRLRSARAVGD